MFSPKNLILLLALLWAPFASQAQSCFIQEDDATGSTAFSTAQLAELEAAACSLRAVFPPEFQADFAVYDFGFYLHQESYVGGVPQVFQDKIAKIEQESPYFLVFGRQYSKDGLKLWIDLNIPNNPNVACEDKNARILAILNELSYEISNGYSFFNIEYEAISMIGVLRECENCENEIDDDGDGFIDCEDNDCIVQYHSLYEGSDQIRNSLTCEVPTPEEISCLLDYHDFLNINGCEGTESALNFCEKIIALQNLSLPTQSEYEKLILYIKYVRDLTCNRCSQYDVHCEFINNWLTSIENSSGVTIGEVYDMAVWCKGLRDQILSMHLLQFGADMLGALEIAAWEYDLFVTLRFFNAVPLRARNFGIVRMINKMTDPISSFQTLQYAQKYGINTYEDLVKLFNSMGWSRAAKGVEFHHLIEQRFKNVPGVAQWLGSSNPNNWKCIVVAKGSAEHTPKFTTPWKQAIPYDVGQGGLTTATATLDDVKNAARSVYSEYPEILSALGL